MTKTKTVLLNLALPASMLALLYVIPVFDGPSTIPFPVIHLVTIFITRMLMKKGYFHIWSLLLGFFILCAGFGIYDTIKGPWFLRYLRTHIITFVYAVPAVVILLANFLLFKWQEKKTKALHDI